MSSKVSSSSSLVTMGELPFPAHSNVKEKGGSSLSFCTSFLERLEGGRFINIHGCVRAFCSNCSKTIELSKEEYCNKRFSIHSDSGNYSAKSSTATNNPQVQENTEQRKTDIVGLNSADINGESKASERKDKCRAETLGKWKGLKQENHDHEIVWPPMVVIRNTCPTKNESRQWVGITSQELLDLFSAYDCIAKAHHAHDSQGHRGMSVLIFEGSARGYLEAERLHKHLADQGTDRNAWNHSPFFLSPDGKHQLYGYLAVKEDVDLINQSSTGRSKLKYSMRSYQEMVVKGISKLYDDNHQLLWLKNRAAQKQMQLEAIREKLNQAVKENHVLRDRINLQHEQHLEEMNCQEQFFKDQLMSTLEARAEKEEDSVSTQSEGEYGYETAQLSSRIPLNTQGNKEQTAQSKKNKGKEKEEIVAETDDEPGRVH